MQWSMKEAELPVNACGYETVTNSYSMQRHTLVLEDQDQVRLKNLKRMLNL